METERVKVLMSVHWVALQVDNPLWQTIERIMNLLQFHIKPSTAEPYLYINPFYEGTSLYERNLREPFPFMDNSKIEFYPFTDNEERSRLLMNYYKVGEGPDKYYLAAA